MRRTSAGRVWAIGVIAGMCTGALIAGIKGTGGGIRYDIGNDVVLWLILPTVIGIAGKNENAYTRFAFSSLAVLAALASFYLVSDEFTLDAWRHVLQNRVFFLVVGTFAASLFTLAVALVARKDSWYGVVLLGVACLLEPLIIPFLGRGTSGRSTVFEIQAVCGLGLICLSLSRIRREARRSPKVRPS